MAANLETTNEDNQFTGPRASPTIPDGGSFSVYNKVVINAPPQAVYDALVDVSRWPEWNPLVKKVDVTKAAAGQKDTNVMAEGMEMTFHSKMGSGESMSTSGELVVQAGPVRTGGRTTARWVAHGMMTYAVKAEHVNWLDDNGDGTTTYQHWETFGGLAAFFIKKFVGGVLQERFIAWAEDLKTYVEKSQKAGA